MNNIKEINLSQILTALLRKAWLIIVCAVLAGTLTYAYTVNFITPQYRSHVTIYVNNKVEREDANSYSSTDLATSQRLVATYITILKSDKVLEPVCNKVKQSYGASITPDYIRAVMTAKALDETEIFEVAISSGDKWLAAEVANAIADEAPPAIEAIIKGSSASYIDKAKVASAPYTPVESKNTTYGMIAGALIAVVFIVLQTMMDVRVKGEDDLAVISQAPVLGLIPDLVMDIRGEYGYTGYKYASGYKAKDSTSQSDTKKSTDGEAGK